MKYIYKHFVASTAFGDLWVICTAQLLQLMHYSTTTTTTKPLSPKQAYFFFSWHTVMKLSNIEAESRVITNHAVCRSPYKRFSLESYFVTLSYFQVCMVIVAVYWLTRSKGLIGSFLVHEVHFNRKLNTLLCMQSYSKPKERVCQVKI